MNKRDRLQQRAVQDIINHKFRGLIDISPRFGKSRVIIDALKSLKNIPKTLILAPFNTIIDSWHQEFDKWGMDQTNIEVRTTRWLLDQKELPYQLIITDECHRLSEAQIAILKAYEGPILGLSGSISPETKWTLRRDLGLKVIHEYGVDEAVKDEIVADYQINIVTLPLDDKDKYIVAGTKDKPFFTTEKKHYEYLSAQVRRAMAVSRGDKSKDGWVKSLLGKRSRAVYSYRSKLKLAKKLIDSLEDKVLVFTTLTANDLCEHKHDSKSDGTNLDKFINGEISKLQVCNMVSMGK